MLAVQLGESANELIAQWKREGGGYRYGFPDFYAAEFPVRPMYYDQSRIYSGVIGRHYPDAKTGRYHYMFDQNMYQQPGFGNGATTPSSAGKAAVVGVAAVVAVASIGAAIFFAAHARSAHRAIHRRYPRR